MKSDEFSIKRLAENFEFGERNKNLNEAIEKQYDEISTDNLQEARIKTSLETVSIDADFSGKKLKSIIRFIFWNLARSVFGQTTEAELGSTKRKVVLIVTFMRSDSGIGRFLLRKLFHNINKKNLNDYPI